MRILLLFFLLACLLAAAPAPQDGGAKAPPEEDYAKVELRGEFTVVPGTKSTQILIRRRDSYVLDLTGRPDLSTEEALGRLDGKTVIVTGLLEPSRVDHSVIIKVLTLKEKVEDKK